MPSTREMLRDGSLMRMLYLTFSEVWAASARRPCSAWKELYQEFAEPPSPEPTQRELLEFRDRASTDQLMAFALETKYLFDERRHAGMVSRSVSEGPVLAGAGPGDPGPDERGSAQRLIPSHGVNGRANPQQLRAFARECHAVRRTLAHLRHEAAPSAEDDLRARPGRGRAGAWCAAASARTLCLRDAPPRCPRFRERERAAQEG